MGPRVDGFEAMRKIYAERAAAYEKEARTATPPSGTAERSYRDVTHRHSEACTWQVGETRRYLGRVHRFWEKSTGHPTLDEVRYKYLYGNDFSEEGQGATPIAADPSLRRLR